MGEPAKGPPTTCKMEDAGDTPTSPPHEKVEKTLIDHLCVLNEPTKKQHKRLTRIICTIGHKCRDVPIIERMIGAGMNVARLNFAYESHEQHVEYILNIRKAVEFFNKKHVFSFPLAIALDTVGPEIWTGSLEGGVEKVRISSGAKTVVTTDRAHAHKGSVDCIYVDYHNIVKVMKPGDRILIDRGLISLVVNSVGVNFLNCTVETGGYLGNNQIVNLPGVPIDLPAFTDRDRDDIEFGLNHGVDMICASFIRSAVAVNEFRALIDTLKVPLNKKRNVILIAKIENAQALMHIDEIIDAADGVMVVRSKLAFEFSSTEKVIAAQTTVIARCNRVGKPVIITSQMLESMMTRLRPSRSEVTDVANAIISGADCVMLTGETASGSYPFESIDTMARICKEAEAAIWHPQFFSELVGMARLPFDALETVAVACVEASFLCMASAIIVVTTNSRAAHLVSRYRPRCPIVSVTRNPKIARQNQIYRGIMSVHYKERTLDSWLKDLDCRVAFGLMLGKNREFLQIGDPVVIMHGWKEGTGFMNTMRVIHVPDPAEVNVMLPTNEAYTPSMGNLLISER